VTGETPAGNSPRGDPVVTMPKLRYVQLTPQQRDADLWAEQILRERLPRTRELAKEWGATVAAVTALFGTGTVIDADAAVRALLRGWAAAYGVLVCLAILAAGGAILFASSAAQARLTVIPPGATERVATREQLVTLSLRDLRVSRWLAAAALLLLIASFGVRWYAPRQETAKTAVATQAGP